MINGTIWEAMDNRINMSTKAQTDFLSKMEKSCQRAMESYLHGDTDNLLIELDCVIQYAEWVKKLVEKTEGK